LGDLQKDFMMFLHNDQSKHFICQVNMKLFPKIPFLILELPN